MKVDEGGAMERRLYEDELTQAVSKCSRTENVNACVMKVCSRIK